MLFNSNVTTEGTEVTEDCNSNNTELLGLRGCVVPGGGHDREWTNCSWYHEE